MSNLIFSLSCIIRVLNFPPERLNGKFVSNYIDLDETLLIVTFKFNLLGIIKMFNVKNKLKMICIPLSVVNGQSQKMALFIASILVLGMTFNCIPPTSGLWGCHISWVAVKARYSHLQTDVKWHSSYWASSGRLFFSVMAMARHTAWELTGE